jgi:PKD repeat protein
MKNLLLFISIVITFNCQSQNIYCWADFYYTQNGPTTIFTDYSSVAPANSWANDHSLSWLWDFGDGNTSNLQNPTHNYINGTYMPCLTLTMFDSTVMNTCVSTTCDTVISVSTTSLPNQMQTNNNKKILSIIDVLGRRTKGKKNTPLFYIYDDGTVEKKIILE